MRKIRTAVVGCGMISDIYLQNLSTKFSVIDLVACANRTHEKAVRAAEKFGIRAMTLEEILNDESIEMVVNLTTPGSHFEVTSRCLEHGKHVYTEKVLAPRLEDAQVLLRLADEKGMYLGAAPDTFLGGAIQTARWAVDSGLIGQVTSCSAFNARDYRIMTEYFPFIVKEGGGIGFDLGIYYMTALMSILGPARRVTGLMKKDPARTDAHFRPSSPLYGESYTIESETILTGCIEFQSGVYGTFQMNSDCINPEQPAMVICGTEGILTMDDPNCFGGTVSVRVKGSSESVPLPNDFGFNENMRGIGAAEMAWSIIKGRPPRAGKEMACHALETLTGMAMSSETGAHYTLTSTFERPRPLPRGYLDSDYMHSDPEAALAL